MSDTIIYRCPDCGAAVEFDPGSGMLYCQYCGQFYEAKGLQSSNNSTNNNLTDRNYEHQSLYNNVFGHSDDINVDALDKATDDYAGNVSDYMQMRIYTCKSCGAEIMTGDVEVSNYCSYCGQPTIIFDRISNELKPDLILPFSISKEEAIQSCKHKFMKAICLPDEFENITVESVYGIYMPFWVYDADVLLSARLMYRVSEEKTSRIIHEQDVLRQNRKAVLDASRRFSDYTSRFLNPFPIENAVEFNPAYLSGFYADRKDVEKGERENDARNIMRDEMLNEWCDTFSGAPDRQARELYRDLLTKTNSFDLYAQEEKFTFKAENYVFLPVYFLTFRMGSQFNILLVNGSSGKVVGSMPADPNKVKAKQNINMIIGAIIMAVIGGLAFGFLPIIWSSILMVIVAGSFVLTGRIFKKRYEDMAIQTNSDKMFSISRNREVR